MTTVILRNTTGSPITLETLGGLTIAQSGASATIVPDVCPETYLWDIYSKEIKALVDSGSLVMNVNGNDVSASDADSWMDPASIEEVDTEVSTESDSAFAESDGVTSTDSTLYIQKVRLSFTPVSAGDYLLFWSTEFTTNDETRYIGLKIELNDTTVLNEIIVHIRGPEAKLDYDNLSGFSKVTLSAIAHTIDMDFNSELAGKFVNLRRSRLYIRRL